ncbi:hypothetical protein B0T10DRAFT_607710 [Thelonectria olida]|uniref:Uncharacterized protein n=1 Tax=Thelonectria olida TaxID=1576542 RepID=A0A9P8W376_9HYPO|nr:hypothetical protein B0T10DRAFT_607710 [Thelonectria olida]
MPSDVSKALVLRGSPPSPTPTKSSAKSKRSRPRELPSIEDAYHDENKSVWRAVKAKNGNRHTAIVAIVKAEQKKELEKMIKEKKRKGKIQSTIVIATARQLQEKIDSTLDANCTSLYLFVSSTVNSITYDIGKVIKDVYVAPCQPASRPDVLRIGSASKYCNVKAYAWEHRPTSIRRGGYQITYAEGCHFDISDDLEDARRLLNQPITSCDMQDDELAKIKSQFLSIQEEMASGPVSSDGSVSSYLGADQTGNWFEKWKGLLAMIIAAGTGTYRIGGAITAVWVSGGGVYIKGPLGLSIAAGYFNVAAFAGAVGAGGMMAIAAWGAVYFVPWDRLWNLVREKLSQIWEVIRDVAAWIWEKMKALASTFVSEASVGPASQAMVVRFSD